MISMRRHARLITAFFALVLVARLALPLSGPSPEKVAGKIYPGDIHALCLSSGKSGNRDAPQSPAHHTGHCPLCAPSHDAVIQATATILAVSLFSTEAIRPSRSLPSAGPAGITPPSRAPPLA